MPGCKAEDVVADWCEKSEVRSLLQKRSKWSRSWPSCSPKVMKSLAEEPACFGSSASRSIIESKENAPASPMSWA